MRARDYSILLITICLLTYGNAVRGQTGNLTHGTDAGVSITSGDNNVAVGESAGNALTSGSFNTFVGKSAGALKDNDTDNTIIGAYSNDLTTEGVDNVYIGTRVARSATTNNNTIIGTEAGTNITTANHLTIVGETAGYNLTTGSRSTFLGEDAGYNTTTAKYNTFIGSVAGRQNQIGYRNTAVGNDALYFLGHNGDDAHHNTAIGDSAGKNNSRGIYNTFIGAASGAENNWADNLTFVGAYAGFGNNSNNSQTTSDNNTYVGYQTGYTNDEGENNVGMGAHADFNNTNIARTTFIGASINADGDDVVAFGVDVEVREKSIGIGAYSRMRCSNSVGIGYYTDARPIYYEPSTDYVTLVGHETRISGTNSAGFGYKAIVYPNNEVYFGNNGITSIGGQVAWTATSDGRFKKNVTTNVPGLEFIDELRPVTYQFDLDKLDKFQGRESTSVQKKEYAAKENIRYSGFIAQEVAELAEKLNFQFSGVDKPQNEADIYGLRYAEFVAPLVKASQELQQKIETQKAIMGQQKSQIQEFEKKFSQLEKQLKSLEMILQ